MRNRRRLGDLSSRTLEIKSAVSAVCFASWNRDSLIWGECMNRSSGTFLNFVFGGMRKSTVVCALCLSLLFFCSPSFSQVTNGRISGSVSDQTGGAIVGATVTVTDVARGVSRPLVTGSAGEYVASPLTPG